MLRATPAQGNSFHARRLIASRQQAPEWGDRPARSMTVRTVGPPKLRIDWPFGTSVPLPTAPPLRTTGRISCERSGQA
jgi:hypothetical protein